MPIMSLPIGTHHAQQRVSSTTNLIQQHPHPLRSHSSSENLLAPIDSHQPSTPPPTLSISRPDHDNRGARSFRTPRGSRNSLHVLPSIPQVPSQTVTFATEERFGDCSRPGTSCAEFPVIPIRAPLRPRTADSFSANSQVTYFSNASFVMEQKSMAAWGEEFQGRKTSILRRDWRFYGCFGCLCLLNFMCDLSTTAVSTALPDIAHDLNLTAVQTFWIPGSFLLSAALAQTLFMRLSSALGCKSLLLFGCALFTAGSILAACSQTTTGLLVGRSIEGIGAGAVGVLTQLTLSQISRIQVLDNKARRVYQRAASHLFWLGIAAGPIIGGACAKTIGWRNIFWIQILFSVLGLLTLPFLLQLPYFESGGVWSRLAKVDVLGWLLLSMSIAMTTIGVSLGGTHYPWDSPQTLISLVLGLVLLPVWCIYNRYRIDAILPVSIFRSKSAAVSCCGSLVHGALLAAIIYFMPLFFEASGLSSIVAGALLSPWTFGIVALSLLSGPLMAMTGYRIVIWIGWGLATLGLGLMVVFKQSMTAAICAPIGLVGGISLGILLSSQAIAIESAASNDDETINAAPLHLFCTTVGQCFGVLFSSSIFLNSLKRTMLDNSYLNGNALEYTQHAVSMVKVIANLPPEQSGLQTNLIASYIISIRYIWIAACAIAGVAFFLSFWFTEDHTPPRRPSIPELEG